MALKFPTISGPPIIRARGGNRVEITFDGPTVEIDEQVFADALAKGVAARMGRNIRKGLKSDGSGPMPGRKKDGRPRGKGSRIAMAISPKKTADLEYEIAAHQELPGHLARILRGVPFDAPPYATMKPLINSVLGKAIRVVVVGSGNPWSSKVSK